MFVFVFNISGTDAAVTKYINYQGKLTDAAGDAVADGAYTIRFRVYNHVSDDPLAVCNPGVNSCLWESSVSVTTVSGLFSVNLGADDVFSDTNFSNYNGADYYLGVQVTGDSEMTPRKRVTGALYALNSDRLGGKQETEFADLDENESITGLWTIGTGTTGAALNQGSLYVNASNDVNGHTLIGIAQDGTSRFNLGTTSASGDAQLTMYADDGTTSGNISYASQDSWVFQGGSIKQVQAATESLWLDASSTTHTGTDGVLNIDVTSDTNFVTGVDVKLKSSAGMGAFQFPFNYSSHLVPNSGDNANAYRVGYFSNVASDEALAAGDFKANLFGYMFYADTMYGSTVQGTSTSTGYYSQIGSSSTGGATSFSSGITKSVAGDATGLTNGIQSTATGNVYAVSNSVAHNGIGSAYGDRNMISGALIGNLYGENSSVTANAGMVGNIYGNYIAVTNNSASADGNFKGLYVSATNNAGGSVNSFDGAQIVVNAAGTQPSSNGLNVENQASLGQIIYLNGAGTADYGIKILTSLGIGMDLSGATIATADIILSEGTQLIDLGSNKLSFSASLLPATGDTYDLGGALYNQKWQDGIFSRNLYAAGMYLGGLYLTDSQIFDTNSNLTLVATGDSYVYVNDQLSVNGTITGTGTIGSATSAWSDIYVNTAHINSGLSATGDATFVLGAANKVSIDAATTLHTGSAAGALQVDYKSNTNNSNALLVNMDSSGTSGGSALYGVKTALTTGAGDYSLTRLFEANISTDAAATSDVYSFSATGTKTNAGVSNLFYGNTSHNGAGDMKGLYEALTHSGTGDLWGTHQILSRTGTGLLYGSQRTLSVGATASDGYGDYTTFSNSADFTDFTGYYLDMTHDTTAATTGTMTGLDITLKNQAVAQNSYGIKLDINNSSNPTGDSEGIRINSVSGNLDSFIVLNNAAQFGLDMDSASFTSYDIRLSDGEYIKNAANDTIELGGRVNVPAYTTSPAFEVTLNHSDTNNGYGALSAITTGVSGVTYGIYASNDSSDINSAGGEFHASAGRAVSGIASTGWAGFFYSDEGVFMSKLSVGDTASPDYNTIGTGSANHASIDSASDLFIEDDLEVDGLAFFDGGHTDIAEYIIVTENGQDKKVNFINEDGFRKTDLSGAILIADSAHPEKAILTDLPYDKRIIGIVATKPSMTISGGISEKYGYPLVLAGRIPTNVCGENGSIEIGDFITTSSKAGYGMKATDPGMVVGQALEAFAGESSGECGQIMVFQNIGWYHNAEGAVSTSVTFGLENVEGGNFSKIDTNISLTNDLHIQGKLYGYNNNWLIDENGVFTVHEKFDGGQMDLYALMSVKKEITMSGRDKLQGGVKQVLFDNNIDKLISDDYNVLITPTGPCQGLFVVEKKNVGFVVRELGGGTSDVSFDWMIVAPRSGFASPTTDPIDNIIIAPGAPESLPETEPAAEQSADIENGTEPDSVLDEVGEAPDPSLPNEEGVDAPDDAGAVIDEASASEQTAPEGDSAVGVFDGGEAGDADLGSGGVSDSSEAAASETIAPAASEAPAPAGDGGESSDTGE